MRSMFRRSLALVALPTLVAAAALAQSNPTPPTPPTPSTAPATTTTPSGGTMDWRRAEAGTLTDQAQLTFAEQFLKAGEAYFSPTGRWIIFQATPAAGEGEEASAHYGMYVARLVRDEGERITGIEAPILISAEGSANTCGFFDPVEPWRVIFGSTLVAPAGVEKSGYQRGSSRYRWSFPREMEVVRRVVPDIFFDGRSREGVETDWAEGETEARPIFERDGYDAECAYSPDGRHIVYSQVDPETGDSDIFVLDTRTNVHRPLVVEKGYDGGPFFSPDGAMICYRSDRRGDDLLQLYIGILAYDDTGAILGVKSQRAVTENRHVNWAPFWHPWQNYLIYATSEVGHDNYEVFSTEVPIGTLAEKSPSDLRRKRLTFAAGFDGLPVFSGDGKWMMWTSQRGPLHAEEEKPSSQLWVARVVETAP